MKTPEKPTAPPDYRDAAALVAVLRAYIDDIVNTDPAGVLMESCAAAAR